jgi:TonB family protein
MTTALTAGQNPPAPEKPFDSKRCTPRVMKQGDLPKNMSPFVQKGEKSTGYSPLISFEILESGKVANARVKRSSGFARVDKYALESIRRTTYNACPGCGAIETTADVLIHWN